MVESVNSGFFLPSYKSTKGLDSEDQRTYAQVMTRLEGGEKAGSRVSGSQIWFEVLDRLRVIESSCVAGSC